jgi:hypothetical protein
MLIGVTSSKRNYGSVCEVSGKLQVKDVSVFKPCFFRIQPAVNFREFEWFRELRMTEAEWHVCEVPDQMLTPLQGWASERKFRLLTPACLRQAKSLNEFGPMCDVIQAIESSPKMAKQVWSPQNV